MTEEAWKRVNKVVYANNIEEANKAYTEWADTFDNDVCSKLGVMNNEELAKNSIMHIKNDKSAQLLDLGAGTGLAAEALLQHGYEGIMDAVELNGEILKKAESKGLYRKHICFKITPDQPIPVEECTYDTVTCSGALGKNHLEEGCIRQMIPCLKPGGILVFNTRKTDANKEYVEKLDAVMKQLVECDRLSKIKIQEVLNYSTQCKETGDLMKAFLYIYKKL